MSDYKFNGINWRCKNNRCKTIFPLKKVSIESKCPRCGKRVSLRDIKNEPLKGVCKDQILALDPMYLGVYCKLGGVCELDPSRCHIRVRERERAKQVKWAKCPACKEAISKDDLAPLLTPRNGIAWVCEKCQTIIGFVGGSSSSGSGLIVDGIFDSDDSRRMDDDRMMWEQW
jgi:hypothetical protein